VRFALFAVKLAHDLTSSLQILDSEEQPAHSVDRILIAAGGAAIETLEAG
jgi:hypothetical protein